MARKTQELEKRVLEALLSSARGPLKAKELAHELSIPTKDLLASSRIRPPESLFFMKYRPIARSGLTAWAHASCCPPLHRRFPQ